MAPPSAETLQRIASDTGLPAPTLGKVLRLQDLLQASPGTPFCAAASPSRAARP